MTYDEIMKACIERAPDDQVLQDAFDELIYQHVGTDKTASAINNAGAERQVEVLKEKGYATERILIEIAEQLAISVHTLGERVSSPVVPVKPPRAPRSARPVKPPVLKRVRFTYEVLVAPDDTSVEKMGLADIQMACEQGDCSGHFIETTTKMLNLRQAKLACAEHATDPEFFELPEFEIGTRVWWSDPDADSCSGWYVIKTFNGEIYGMTNAAGGECEALGKELSLKKPKKGKKS